jgi:4-hydroxy-4-methyl-2-oxoglutarate aldolase
MDHDENKSAAGPEERAELRQLLEGYLAEGITAEHVFSGGGLCMSRAVQPLVPGGRFAGWALTVRTAPGWLRRPLEALARAGRDDVLVIDAGGDSELASWGGMVSYSAARKGIRGVVIDGVTRDILEIRQLNPPLPVFARGQAPGIAGFGPPSSGTIGQPIICGGVQVNTGDLVFGDDDGVVVVPRERVEQVLELATKSITFDEKERQWIDAGGSVYDLIRGLWDPDGVEYKDRKWRWVDSARPIDVTRPPLES